MTASELNNMGFEIERSVNSIGVRNLIWEKIGFVEGNGTTTETNHYTFINNSLSQGVYQYRLKQIDFDGTFEYSQVVEAEIFIADEFILNQNHPNPFNPSTTISWQLPLGSWLTLKVYDLMGREVVTLLNEYKPAGSYEIEFNASHLSSGVYFYTLKTDNNISTRKLLILR
ncbi:MAG: T9SS type A sorting domain-containing protein [Ignavibacterium sp.]|nr:T9SS type A sorting domain-containing protein [Ignavibacterium sp.]